ncbi:MAG: transcriptional regulator [Spirochaetales bacterium]|nr:transcriptional regulator [Spirochaetales bacterium]
MPSSKTTAKSAKKKKTAAKAVARPKPAARSPRKAPAAKKTTKESSEFIIGDYVVYPMHGVGQICSIKKEVILGERKPCYIFEIASSKMKVTIPTEKAKQIGIRPIIAKREVKKVLDLLLKEEVDTEEDWKIRYQNNMNKIKSGSIYSVAEVCRDLYKRARDKELSLMERRLYESAYSLISSEIALSRQVTQEEAGNLISEVLSAS